MVSSIWYAVSPRDTPTLGHPSYLPLTALLRQTVIEVLDYDPATRESVVLSALGERADWNRNIQASPPALPSAAGCGAGGRSAGGPSAPLAADSERQGQAIRALLPRAGR